MFRTALAAIVNVLPAPSAPPPAQLASPVTVALVPCIVPPLIVKLVIIALTPATVPPAMIRLGAAPLSVSVPPITLTLPAPVIVPLSAALALNATVPLATFKIPVLLNTTLIVVALVPADLRKVPALLNIGEPWPVLIVSSLWALNTAPARFTMPPV